MTRIAGSYFISVLFMLLVLQSASGQKSLIYDNDDLYYKQAMDLFEKENYVAAQYHFEKAAEHYRWSNTVLSSNSQYYSALCALRLHNNDAAYLMLKFISENPASIYRNEAHFNMGLLYFRQRNYRKSSEWFRATRHEYLNESLRDEYFFKLGYSHFMRDEPEDASRAFFVIREWDSPYAAAANYYYSHIAYSQENYATALQGFLSLRDHDSFAALVPYYIIQIYYKQRRYDEVIENGPDLLRVAEPERIGEIARLIGDSYYRRRNYEGAIHYLEIFRQNVSTVTSGDLYQIGFSYYQLGRYEEAARMFESASGKDGPLDQNINYHLADCYIRLGEKPRARMAFAAAARVDYDKTVQEDALFQYSLLTFEIAHSPFNEAINGFNTFIELFPESHRIDEAYNYLVMAYMNTRNYREALASIGKISVQTSEIRSAHQRIAYFRGLELYSNLRFEDAARTFAISLENSQFDPVIAAQTYYWKGESHYRLGNFDRAIANYNRLLISPGAFQLDVYHTAHYNMGYAYLKKEDYQNAISWFRRYLNFAGGSATIMTADAANRLGDSYFATGRYSDAIEYYNLAIANGRSNKDYALFQKAIALGLLSRQQEKITVLNTIISEHPDSPHLLDALFETGNSWMAVNSPESAIPYYRRLAEDFPASSYVSSALLQLGLIDYNRGDNQSAIEYYKRVAENYPGTSESRSALTGLRNIYIDLNDINSFVAYTETLGDYARVSVSEQDSLSYIAAENLYMAGDCQNAVESFRRYIEQFRNGSFILDAHFYKAECHYRLQQFDEALESYGFVTGMFRNTFTEQALLAQATINFDLGNYGQALANYEELEKVAEMSANLHTARKGQMRSSKILGNHQKTVEAARMVLSDENLPGEIEREAMYNKGVAFMEMDRLDEAYNTFRIVAGEVITSEGAEAKFRIAKIYFIRNDYEKAEAEVYDLVSMNTPHQYWMARAFILLADIYLKMGDDFQARHTLQSIIDNYDVTDDGILAEARALLSEIN